MANGALSPLHNELANGERELDAADGKVIRREKLLNMLLMLALLIVFDERANLLNRKTENSFIDN